MTSFDQFGLHPSVLQGVIDAGYDTPTPVQTATLPLALDGVDVVGVAQTGTGKTAAFVLPILDYLVKEPTRGRRVTRALVVTPTRELAIQVEQAVRDYGRRTDIKSATIYGGVGKGAQRDAVRAGMDILVATPGRLLDLMGENVIDLSHVDILVLDEADRMFDMGFLKDVKRIVAAVPVKRQTMLFSATMPPPIQLLAKTVLYKPETVEIGNRRDPAATVTQRAVRVAEHDKQALLHHILEQEPVEKAIVFSRTKYRADKITKLLARAGVEAVALHSNRSQGQRQRALQGFEAGEYQVMVATDIAGRGIDIDGVSHVVNFDTPHIPEDYIHRIGRTGRAAATGAAISFVSPDEAPNLKGIEKHTGQAIEEVRYESFVPPARDPNEPVDRRYQLGSTGTSGASSGRGGGGRGGARKAPAGTGGNGGNGGNGGRGGGGRSGGRSGGR